MALLVSVLGILFVTAIVSSFLFFSYVTWIISFAATNKEVLLTLLLWPVRLFAIDHSRLFYSRVSQARTASTVSRKVEVPPVTPTVAKPVNQLGCSSSTRSM